MSRAPGPPVNECPLKPTPWAGPAFKRLIWKRPTGWVAAVGCNTVIDDTLISSFEVLARDLACWHQAAHVAAGARYHVPAGRFGSLDYQPPGWAAPSPLVRHECWGTDR